MRITTVLPFELPECIENSPETPLASGLRDSEAAVAGGFTRDSRCSCRTTFFRDWSKTSTHGTEIESVTCCSNSRAFSRLLCVSRDFQAMICGDAMCQLRSCRFVSGSTIHGGWIGAGMKTVPQPPCGPPTEIVSGCHESPQQRSPDSEHEKCQEIDQVMDTVMEAMLG